MQIFLRNLIETANGNVLLEVNDILQSGINVSARADRAERRAIYHPSLIELP